MTLRELYSKSKQALNEAGNDDPAFDALQLVLSVCGLTREEFLVLGGQQAVAAQQVRAVEAAVAQRAQGRPLQYILGAWGFMGLSLSVGEGVLIPRPETELLVRAAAERLAPLPHPRVLDLCAGTGAVALGLATLIPTLSADCVEKYDAPLGFLRRNIAKTGFKGLRAVQGDVLLGVPHMNTAYDALLSNPPYIAAGELPALQREVRREPREALDGGDDGLIFYRAICGKWLAVLRPGGLCAVEIGETQACDVRGIFEGAGLKNVSVLRDLAGHDRVVIGVAP